MATKKKTEDNSGAWTVAIGAAVVAAAGAAFLYGTDAGKKSRKKIKGWTLKAKGEILEKLENAKDVSEETYAKVAAGVIDKYKKIKSIEEGELVEFAKELKGHWNSIKKELNDKANSAKAKGGAKKAPAKKTVATNSAKKAAPKKK